MESVVQDYIMD